MRPTNVGRLCEWQYLERSILRMLAGWGRYMPGFYDKSAIHRYVWEQTECVQRLRDRLAQFPGDNVDNPVNVGSIARNAAAMGWDAIFLDPRSADPLARRALRVSMGNALRVPHARVDDPRELLLAMRDRGVRTVACTPSADATPLAELDPGDAPVLAVFGSERDGLGEDLLAACTDRVRIEMAPGVDSLNVAAASAVVCYALRRWSAAETK